MQENHTKWLNKELPFWVKKGFIEPDKADEILAYYSAHRKNSNTAFTAFSVLGFLLVGLGIILILAYNWDNIGRMERTALAFGLLIAGQLGALFAKKYRNYSTASLEGAAVFWLCSVGAAVAIIGQTYHLGGDLDQFLTVWVLLSLPITYLMRSDAAALLTLAGITYLSKGLSYPADFIPAIMWTLWLPYYAIRFVLNRYKNSFIILSYAFFVCVLFTVAFMYRIHMNHIWVMVFALVPSIFYIIGQCFFNQAEKSWQNPFALSANIILTLLLFVLISVHTWRYIEQGAILAFYDKHLLNAFAIFYMFLIWQFFKRKTHGSLLFVFAPFIALGALALSDSFYSMLFVNIAIVLGGLEMIISGSRKAEIGKINHGLIFLSAVILIQFFEGDFGLIAKGSVFISVGLGLLLFNIFLRRRIARLK
jgi:uncharacterized membrane protein